MRILTTAASKLTLLFSEHLDEAAGIVIFLPLAGNGLACWALSLYSITNTQ